MQAECIALCLVLPFCISPRESYGNSAHMAAMWRESVGTVWCERCFSQHPNFEPPMNNGTRLSVSTFYLPFMVAVVTGELVWTPCGWLTLPPNAMYSVYYTTDSTRSTCWYSYTYFMMSAEWYAFLRHITLRTYLCNTQTVRPNPQWDLVQDTSPFDGGQYSRSVVPTWLFS